MRHKKSGRRLSRNASHRKAMYKNMSVSLIEHELIKTTLPKAKELRRFFEPLITRGKNDSVHNRRQIFAKIRDDSAVNKLFTQLAPRYANRAGGYLRIYKSGYRKGDAAMMAYVVLVDSEHDLKSDNRADNNDHNNSTETKAPSKTKETKKTKVSESA